MILTSVQEAAFAAFQEAAADLLAATGMARFEASAVAGKDGAPVRFATNTTKANDDHDYIFGRGETLADAARDLIAKYEPTKIEAAKLRTAAEAVAAVKQIVGEIAESGALGEDDVNSASLIARLDALPVA